MTNFIRFIKSGNKFENFFLWSNVFPPCLSNQKKKENSKIQQRFLMEKIILQYIYISFKPRLTRPTKRFNFYSRNPGSSNPFSGGKRWPVSGLARENFQRTVCALLHVVAHVARIKLADVQLEFFTSARCRWKDIG